MPSVAVTMFAWRAVLSRSCIDVFWFVLQWFDDKIQLIEAMEVQLKKLHDSSETLVVRRHGVTYIPFFITIG